MKILSFNANKFFIKDEYDRFIQLELWLAVVGENNNKSFIDKLAYEKAKDTIEYIPLCCELNKNGTDMLAHEKNEYPIGAVVDFAKNNYRYEIGDDGREYIVVDAIVFKDYCEDEADIILKDGIKGISIEIGINDGYKDKEDGLYHITDFFYMCCTVLGNNYGTGMPNARLEVISEDTKERYAKFVLDIKSQINEVFSNKMDTEESTVEIIEDETSENINNQEEIKGSENNMTFNKKDHALKFSLTAIQLAEEFSKACYSVKYTEEWYGDTYECCKYGFRDYDDTYMYAMDYECGYMVGAKYSFEGDAPVIDFANAIRMKCTYVPFDLGAEDAEDAIEDDIVIDDYSAKEFKENNKSKFELLETKVKDLKDKVSEFEANKVEDKTEQVNSLETKVAEFTKLIEEKDQTILDLGFKYDSLAKEKELVDEKLANFEVKISEFVNKEVKEKANVLFSKISNGLTKEENDSLLKEIEEIKDEETFKVFESKVKDLALARFSSIASNKDNVAKFHRNSVVSENIELEKEEPKDIWDKLKENIKK